MTMDGMYWRKRVSTFNCFHKNITLIYETYRKKVLKLVACGIRYSTDKVYLHSSPESSAIKLKDNKYLHTINKYHL